MTNRSAPVQIPEELANHVRHHVFQTYKSITYFRRINPYALAWGYWPQYFRRSWSGSGISCGE